MNGAGEESRHGVGSGWELCEMVGHHRAVDGFRGMGWPPTDDNGAVTGLVKDVPDGFGFARKDCDWAYT